MYTRKIWIKNIVSNQYFQTINNVFIQNDNRSLKTVNDVLSPWKFKAFPKKICMYLFPINRIDKNKYNNMNYLFKKKIPEILDYNYNIITIILATKKLATKEHWFTNIYSSGNLIYIRNRERVILTKVMWSKLEGLILPPVFFYLI